MWIRKLPLVPTLITLVCVVIMFGLGLWQLDRKIEKDQRLVQIEERKQSRALSPTELEQLMLNNSQNNIDDLQDFPITFNAKALSAQLFYIDNKIHEGKVGYEVVMPVQLEDESTFVLVNLGWIQGVGARGTRDALPILSETELSLMRTSINEAKESITIDGVVKYPSINKMVSETNQDYGQFPAVLQQIDLSVVAKHLGIYSGQRLLPYIVNLDPNEQSSFVRNWQPVVMAPEKHLGYAVQWFGLAIAALTIYLLSVLKLLHSKNNKES